jgi:hypothetical protein
LPAADPFANIPAKISAQTFALLRRSFSPKRAGIGELIIVKHDRRQGKVIGTAFHGQEELDLHGAQIIMA